MKTPILLIALLSLSLCFSQDVSEYVKSIKGKQVQVGYTIILDQDKSDPPIWWSTMDVWFPEYINDYCSDGWMNKTYRNVLFSRYHPDDQNLPEVLKVIGDNAIKYDPDIDRYLRVEPKMEDEKPTFEGYIKYINQL